MTVSDEQVIRDHLDLEMLERPHLWPAIRRGMRCVFVKRGGQRGQSGPCFRLDDGGYIIMAADWGSDSDRLTKFEYDSAEAILADEWIVD